MQLKNLIAYRLTQALQLDQAALDQALASKRFSPCASQEASKAGFVNPLAPNTVEGSNDSPPLSLWAENSALICLLVESKILPASAINQKVNDKVAEIEKAEVRKVYRKEKDQIKDQVLQEYLPKALTKRATTYAAIDLQSGLVYVDANTHKQAETVLSSLREAIGSLPVRPVAVKIAPSATLTDWLKNQKPTHGFCILNDCEMQTNDEGSLVRFKNEDLASDEVLNHLLAGKVVTKLKLAFEDKLSLILQDNLQIKSLRLEDLLRDQAVKDGGDDAASQFTATFVLSILTLRALLPNLYEALGGEEVPGAIEAAAEPTQSAPASSESALLDAAERFVTETGNPSVSAIQRKLKVGYNQAARLVEALEEKGVVSAVDDQGSRTVITAAA